MDYKPRFTNLVDLFTTSTQSFTDKPLFGVRKPSGWQWLTYAEFARMVADARAGLAAIGVGRGDRVAVISNNRIEWAVCAYATFTQGAVYVPMYEAQLDKDWQYILRDSGAKVCLAANGAIAGRLRAMQHELPDLAQVVDFQDSSFTDLCARGGASPVPAAQVGEQDCAMYIYTSGTTGNPKGVELTHYNLAANASAVLEIMPLERDDRSFAFLPWAHVFGGCVELNSIMANGSSMAICENTDKLIEQLPEVAPTMLFAVPRIWNRIYDGVQKQIAGKPPVIQKIFHAGMAAKSKQSGGASLGLAEKLVLGLAEKLIFSKIRLKFGGRLRFAFSGAAALSREVAEFIDNLGIMVFEGYGLTESSGCTTASTPAARKLGAVGKPIPGVRIELDEKATGAGEGEGEILIYGSGVMSGYHNLPEETRGSITAERGLRTGDLGRIDKDGFLYVTGRVKELYKLSNGKYVAPAPLEEKLQLSPYVAQCVVYGSDKPHNVALIVPDMVALESWAQAQGIDRQPESLLADSRTRELIRREIDAYSREFKGFEAVHDFVLSPEPMSMQNDMLTPTFKLKRRNVLKKYGMLLDELYKQRAAS